MKNNALLVVLIGFVLVGCQANEDSLPDFVAQVKQHARKEIIPLPPIKPFKAFEYAQSQSRQPFELPIEAVVQSQPKAKKDCWQPVSRSNKSPLESYALNQLSFKGIIGSGNKVSALISTPEGKLVYVNKGQYIGINHGRITKVAKQYLLIKETLPDGLGCWTQRSIKLALK